MRASHDIGLIRRDPADNIGAQLLFWSYEFAMCMLAN